MLVAWPPREEATLRRPEYDNQKYDQHVEKNALNKGDQEGREELWSEGLEPKPGDSKLHRLGSDQPGPKIDGDADGEDH